MNAKRSSEVQAVVTLTSILDLLGAVPHPMTATEVADSLGMTKSRAWRHLTTLSQLKLIFKLPHEDSYRLGWKLYQLGQLAARRHISTVLAPPYLRDLHRRIGQTVAYMLLAGSELLVVHNLSPEISPSIAAQVGSAYPLLKSAEGRIILSFQDLKTRAQLLDAALDRGETFPDKMGRRAFDALLDDIRARGFERENRVRSLNISAIAAPIFERFDVAHAAVSIMAPMDHLQDPGITSMLVAAAESLSQAAMAAARREGELRGVPQKSPARSRARVEHDDDF